MSSGGFRTLINISKNEIKKFSQKGMRLTKNSKETQKLVLMEQGNVCHERKNNRKKPLLFAALNAKCFKKEVLTNQRILGFEDYSTNYINTNRCDKKPLAE